MSLFLGIDTSNYTTSTALYDSKTGEMVQQKKLLPERHAERCRQQKNPDRTRPPQLNEDHLDALPGRLPSLSDLLSRKI